MGFSKSVYIGPYILVKNKTVETVVTEKFYPSTGAKYSGDGKFCPHTGEEFVIRPRFVNKEVSFRWFSDVEEPLREDAFFSPEYPCLKGNTVHVLNTSIGSYSNDDTFVFDLTDHEIYEILLDFKWKYNGYLLYLTKEGWEFTVHYGIVHYAS